jgi:epoxyqueuosine reductase
MTVSRDRLADELKGRARDEGFDLAGLAPAVPPPHYQSYLDWIAAGMHGEMAYLERRADLRAHSDRLLPGVKAVLAVGLGYARTPQAPAPGKGRIASYALGRDYHKVIRARLRRVAAWLREREPEARVRICVDSAPLLEREYAWLAGLGWFGKNTCIINTHRGSCFLFGFMLTTLDLPPDTPAVGGCGRCRACLDACPTGAIVSPFRVDARRCISYLTIEKRGPIEPELRPLMGDWVFGCDVCQQVCPFNQAREGAPLRARPSTDAEVLPRIEASPQLAELIDLTPEEFERRYSGTAVTRAKREGLVRNARIAKENDRP